MLLLFLFVPKLQHFFDLHLNSLDSLKPEDYIKDELRKCRCNWVITWGKT